MISGGPPPPPPPPGDGRQYLPPSYPHAQYPTPTYYAGQPHAGPAPGIAYAGFGIRFVATLIDDIILGVPFLIIFFATQGSALTRYTDCVQSGGLVTACNSTYLGSIAVFEIMALAVSCIYSVLLWSRLGGTIGRFVGFLISSAVLDIGLIWAAFDPRKQGWHDKMASTFVVRKV